MKKPITLSETATKLLSEFRDADVKFEWAKKDLDGRTPDEATSDPNFKAIWRAHEIARINRNTAACVFAASVAAEVYKEVTNG